MASRSSSSGEPKKEDGLTVVLVMLASVGVIFFLLWMATSVKVVKFWTPKLVSISETWLWLPSGMGVSNHQETIQNAAKFLIEPKKVSLLDWIPFYSNAVMVPNLIVVLLITILLAKVFFKKPANVKRKFKPQDLAIHLSQVFTGIAPVLHLRKKISQDQEPYWRRQLFPHEALLNEKIGGKPLIRDHKVVPELLTEYFQGIVMKKGDDGRMIPERIGDRLVSRMLGRQVVNILSDKGKNLCFPDRFSHTGKVIYALLCAHAFGGDEGKKDYAKARDQLNNSARGAAHGFCNLTCAQWLFDKYRNNPMAKKLFAVHHWEYTYLYELSVQAKRQGKCGHWEYIWLKPMNRILFYTQNTVGRLTPHTESAATFSQYIYERKVARQKRLPLIKNDSGSFVHVIYVDKAVKGLAMEWDRWSEGEEDDNLWWSDPEIWNRINNINLSTPYASPPLGLEGETNFDSIMTAQAKELEITQINENTARAAAHKRGDENINF